MQGWSAGTARVRFTPDESFWLAGYAVRTQPARGTLSELYVSAISLRDAAGHTAVIVSADVIAIPAWLADRAANAVRAIHPEIPRDAFVFAATHTHFGPEVRPDKVPFFRIPEEYARKVPAAADRLRDKLVEAICESLKNFTPVTLQSHQTSAHFSHNRRPTGTITDATVPVLEISDSAGVRSILFSFACHNTTIDPHDYRYSSDWAGRACTLLREAFPHSVPLFLTGCAADQNPHPRGTVELSDSYGKQLAGVVQSAITHPPSPPKPITPSLRIARGVASLPFQQTTTETIYAGLASEDPPVKFKAQFLQQQAARGESFPTHYPAPIQVLLLGDDFLMIFLPGEPTIDYAHKFRHDFDATAVCGYSNDLPGYIPTLRVQTEGGYEGGRATLWSYLHAPWTNDLESIVTAEVRRLVQIVRETKP